MRTRRVKYKHWTPATAKVCVFCQAEYMPTSSTQKTCSNKCRKKLRALNDRRYRGSGEPAAGAPVVRHSIVHRKLRVIFSRAESKGIPFALSEAWWNSQWQAQQGRCALTGFPMQLSGEKRAAWTASVDRIDPKLGYVPDNCRLVCYRANQMRSDMTNEELRVWLESMIHGLNWLEGKTWP